MKKILMVLSITLAWAGAAMAQEPSKPNPLNMPSQSSEDVVLTRSADTDLDVLTTEVRSVAPDCVGISRAGDKVIVHLRQKAPAAMVGQLQQKVTRHVPPPPRPAKPELADVRKRYSKAPTADGKLKILAEYLDLDGGSVVAQP